MIDRKEVICTINRLRSQGKDDACCEAKACTHSLSADVWETVSAFANTHSGIILLGVDERHGFEPCPGFDTSRVIDQFVEGIGDGSPSGARLANPPRYELARLEVEGTEILAIAIEENDVSRKPCYLIARGVASGTFKRVDDKDLLLSKAEIYELQTAGTPVDSDRRPVPETDASDLDAEQVARYLAAMSSSKALRGVADDAQALERLGITDKQGTVRLAGLLTLGVYPQQYFPALIIDVAHHPGTEKSEPGQPRFLDRVTCDGALSETVTDAVRAVLRNLRTISYVDGVSRHDTPEIPEEVLREAIVNAVAHREYQELFVGQSVVIDIYRDRVEVTSPGGLWGGKTLANLADGTSRCRNSTLMHLMETMPVRNGDGLHAERQGSGIPFMINMMRERGLPDPEFYAGIDQFKVVLWRPSAEVAPAEHASRRKEMVVTSRNVTDSIPQSRSADTALDILPTMLHSNRISLDFDGSSHRKERLQQIMNFVEKRAPVGIQEISESLDINLATTRRDIRALLKAGYIQASAPAQSRRRRYYPAPAGHSPS